MLRSEGDYLWQLGKKKKAKLEGSIGKPKAWLLYMCYVMFERHFLLEEGYKNPEFTVIYNSNIHEYLE